MNLNKKLFIPIMTFVILSLGVTLFMTTTSAQSSDQDNSLFDRVARILNIETTTLEDAFKEAGIEGVQERVDNGDISQERGDEIIKKIEEEGFRGFGRKMHQRGMQILETSAEYLEMDVLELREALRSGQTPEEIIEQQGKDVEEAKQLILDQIEERVEVALSEGKIDEEKAEFILENADEKIDAFMSGQKLFRR